MTLINPPAWPPVLETVRTRLVSNGGRFRSPVTGVTQVKAATASHWEFDVKFAVLSDENIWPWRGALGRVQDEGVFLRWGPYPKGLPFLYPAGSGWGTPLVNGASQTGRSLICDGFAAAAGIKSGDFFSVHNGTFLELHMVTADITASGGGAATLPIVPPLRISPADNAPLEFNHHQQTAGGTECTIDPETPFEFALEGYYTAMAFRLIEAWV